MFHQPARRSPAATCAAEGHYLPPRRQRKPLGTAWQRAWEVAFSRQQGEKGQDSALAVRPDAGAAGGLGAAAALRALEGRTLGGLLAAAIAARRSAFVAMAAIAAAAVIAVALLLVLAAVRTGAAGVGPLGLDALRFRQGRGGRAELLVVAAVEGRDGLARHLLDVAQQGPLVVGAEGHGRAVGAGPRRAANPVDVAFRHVGQLELHHVT